MNGLMADATSADVRLREPSREAETRSETRFCLYLFSTRVDKTARVREVDST